MAKKRSIQDKFRTVREAVRRTPPKIAANAGLFLGVHEGIQALDIIQKQPNIVEAAAYVAAGAALIPLNKHVITPLVKGIDNRLKGTKKRIGYNLVTTGTAAFLVALLASECIPRVEPAENFTFSDEYSPTPRLGQQVFQYHGRVASDRSEEISDLFNDWAEGKYNGNCEPIQPTQVMVSDDGEIFVRASCNERRVVEEEPEFEPEPAYCDLDIVRNFQGQDQYEPFSQEARELFRLAAQCVNVPEEWADLDSLHYLLRSESDGKVGIPNYTIMLRSTGMPAKNNPESWVEIHDIMRGGYDDLEDELFNERDFIRTNRTRRTYSSASGLGQLRLVGAEEHYPLGVEGIGNALAEAAGMLSYIEDRYGSPDIAWANYGRFHEGY